MEYDPKPLGPQDIEIKVTHNGLCHSDLHMKVGLGSGMVMGFGCYVGSRGCRLVLVVQPASLLAGFCCRSRSPGNKTVAAAAAAAAAAGGSLQRPPRSTSSHSHPPTTPTQPTLPPHPTPPHKDNDWGLTSFPLIAGHEVVGEVAAKGADVSFFEVRHRLPHHQAIDRVIKLSGPR